MKICSKCKEEKEFTEFFKIGRGDKLRADCKKCFYDFWSKTVGKSEKRVKQRKGYMTHARYLLSSNEYEKLLIIQDFKCAICNKHQSECKKSLSVDHNHVTGEVRGLLCSQCNVGLGMFKENEDSLINAIKYLKK